MSAPDRLTVDELRVFAAAARRAQLAVDQVIDAHVRSGGTDPAQLPLFAGDVGRADRRGGRTHRDALREP